jgi:signal transduction histidine kinase
MRVGEARLLLTRDRGGPAPAAGTGQGRAAFASDAVEAQQRLFAYAAHELRTPLATQRALLELALADPNADAASWREIGEDVLAACRQQERLLEACLTLARSQVRSQPFEPVDLAAITAAALRAHEHHRLQRAVVLGPARTAGDPQLVERLVANLVANAVRHNIPDGRLDVVTRTAAGYATFAIANTGPLIPAGELQRLFQPFQRLDSQRRSSTDGVGLGLAIVHAIAELHDAAVTAQAQPGGGLGIDVAFPALD